MDWVIVVIGVLFICALLVMGYAIIEGRRLNRGEYPDEYGDGGYSDVTGYRGQTKERKDV